ncbi:hypothetical protein [Seleniivibrio sp.]|uniref:hypothetical protein n=1 Tax=Seleniivibrio sp. TaxID=2898801 RepID=UPI0025D80AAD|nr:hypothetical protein [Seleniivibrio sp.]MCD8554662.1 hypothetical protein [Seleniivibrio sp.]
MDTEAFFNKNEDERIKQLTGIANLHISIARDLLTTDRPLSREEMESLLNLLITANEAKRLAQSLKEDPNVRKTA